MDTIKWPTKLSVSNSIMLKSKVFPISALRRELQKCEHCFRAWRMENSRNASERRPFVRWYKLWFSEWVKPYRSNPFEKRFVMRARKEFIWSDSTAFVVCLRVEFTGLSKKPSGIPFPLYGEGICNSFLFLQKSSLLAQKDQANTSVMKIL